MSSILVDFENVNASGLLGVDMLKPTDKLSIFYSKNCSQLRVDMVKTIEDTGCSFDSCKLRSKGKNNLDMYIAAAAGEMYKSGECEIAIISKDKGFQAVVDYFGVSGSADLRILRADNIEQALLSFSDPKDHDRRTVISERSAQLSIDEITFKLNEQRGIRARVKKALAESPYWYRTKDVCEFVSGFVSENKVVRRKTIYISALHDFGRAEGLAIYNIIKEVI